jgi:hypothetical protein
MGAAFIFLGFVPVLVCATSEVAKHTIAHIFHADFIALSCFWTEVVQEYGIY